MEVLKKRALKGTLISAPWATEATFKELDLETLREQTVTLAAPISDVAKVLAKPLKPMRKQISVVRFVSGRIEELTEQTIGLIQQSSQPSPTSTSPATDKAAAEAKTPVPADKPKTAATVAQPVIGCPLPDFDPAEIRANRVLEAFLDADQVDDFRRYRQFVVTGADTGHRYMLTSRHAPDLLAKFGGRQVYDLEENLPICVHDWEVPAAEELLGLALHLTLPNLEKYVRNIPDRQGLAHG